MRINKNEDTIENEMLTNIAKKNCVFAPCIVFSNSNLCSNMRQRKPIRTGEVRALRPGQMPCAINN